MVSLENGIPSLEEYVLEENIEGAENFRAWKYIIMLILEEHDLDGFIKEDVKEPEGEEAKDKQKRIRLK